MTTAIYARKSTDQSGVSDEQKSVARQVEHARAYAQRKGWMVADEHVYIDDGISGAEFANRPGFLRLMNALKPRPAFNVLIMSEESRLGREAIETAYSLKQLVQAGVRVFFYLEDRERTLESPTDKIMLSLTAFANELEREKARQRTYDAMLRKARAGHVTGGRVFGYDNIEILGADGKRSHVERRINDAEAAIVRRIFGLCAAGNGYSRIAKLLNAERALTPRTQQGRPAGWAPTSVKEILDRRLYIGEVVWNQTRKRNAWGQHKQAPRPAAEWERITRPELRIVSDEAWQAARARLDRIRTHLLTVSGGSVGQRRYQGESRYLLVGFAKCAVCGTSLCALSRNHGKHRAFFYGCGTNHRRGITVCDNSLVLPTTRVEDAVLRTLGGDVLRPAVITAILDGVLAEFSATTTSGNLERLHADLRDCDRSIENLAVAIADAGDIAPLMAQLKARQVTRDQLRTAIEALQDDRGFDRQMIEKKIRHHVKRWRSLLATKRVEDGRQLLRECLRGPLRFTPNGRTYQFEGELDLGRVLAGEATLAHFMASPTGFDPYRQPFTRLFRAA